MQKCKRPVENEREYTIWSKTFGRESSNFEDDKRIGENDLSDVDSDTFSSCSTLTFDKAETKESRDDYFHPD